jgi:hypothetical protein
MSARSSVIRVLVRGGMVVGSILAVTILLAAMPGHHAPSVEGTSVSQRQSSTSQSTAQDMPGMDYSKMNMDMSAEQANEGAAVSDMNHMHGGTPHMHLTEMRQQTPDDAKRANEIVAQLREGIEKYKDYRVALNDGFRIFLPDFPQPEYHFTSFKNGLSAASQFDPSKPTSLLYRKTTDGYELVGAMYTMPKRATEDQLNERVPLSVAMWHLHTNLCMPPKGRGRSADRTKFGLRGSISTQEACDAAGGRFHPSVFGWMVHVYPYENSLDKIFAMHHGD